MSKNNKYYDHNYSYGNNINNNGNNVSFNNGQPYNNPYAQIVVPKKKVDNTYSSSSYNHNLNFYKESQSYNTDLLQQYNNEQQYNYNNGQQSQQKYYNSALTQYYDDKPTQNYNVNPTQNYNNSNGYTYNQYRNNYIMRPKVNFIEAVKGLYKNYFVFSGRASRSEYWWSTLFIYSTMILLLIGFDVNSSETTINSSTANNNSSVDVSYTYTALGDFFFYVLLAFILATTIPYISLHARRLHDVNLSGWFYFVTIIPYIGFFALVALLVQDSKPAGKRFDKITQPWVPEQAKLPNVIYKK